MVSWAAQPDSIASTMSAGMIHFFTQIPPERIFMKYLFGYLLIINALSFTLMLEDKLKAKNRHWRIPEAVLMLTAVIGGSVGMLAAMHLFRHKTKHQKFTVGVPCILLVQVVLFIAWY
jgi:uncharacterized membrane protein YsdA (DUF1294 family)